MKTTNWKTWAKAALIRAIRTFAEAMLAYIGTGALVLGDVNWLGRPQRRRLRLHYSCVACVDRLARSRAGIKLNTACPMPRTGSNSSSGVLFLFWEIWYYVIWY